MTSRSSSQAWSISNFSFVEAVALASTFLTGLIFALISLGGLVRNAGAGLSCPDWPLCYGKVVPPMDAQVFLEWFHRLIAGSVSVVLVGVTAAVFFKPELRRRAGKYCVAALALLALQIVLGGLTVLGLLAPKWVASHLVVGQAFFSAVLLLTLELRDLRSQRAVSTLKRSRGFSWLAGAAVLTLFAQIALGGMVSSNYAGLACPDVPMCNGMWLPPFEGLVKFQWLHRVGAVLAVALTSWLCFSSLKREVSPRARLALRGLPGLLTLQICLGVGSVLLKLPLLMSVAHLATAAGLLGLLVVTNYEIRRS